MDTPQPTARRERRHTTSSRYNDLISQLQLERVWLQDARIQNLRGMSPPDGPGDLDVEHVPDWSKRANGFDAISRYRFRLKAKGDIVGEVEVSFGLRYHCPVPMTHRLFELFGSHNLLLNSWPYAREFLGSTTSRFGWTAVTLPVFRPGQGISTASLEHESGATAAPAPREADRTLASSPRERRGNAGQPTKTARAQRG